MTKLKRICTPEQYREACLSAERAGFSAVSPTHYVEKAGDVVGSLSVGGLPLFSYWCDPGKVNSRDSYQILQQGEAVASDRQLGAVAMFCEYDSPYVPLLDRMGFQELMRGGLYLKEVN